MSYPAKDASGRPRTPFAVICHGPFDIANCGHGLVYLTQEEYDQQMNAPDRTWRCPICRYDASWDDDNYEEMIMAVEDVVAPTKETTK